MQNKKLNENLKFTQCLQHAHAAEAETNKLSFFLKFYYSDEEKKKMK